MPAALLRSAGTVPQGDTTTQGTQHESDTKE